MFDRFKKKSDDGKSDDDQSKAEMDALVERFSAAVDERVKPLRETVENLQTKWNTIEAEATKAAAPDNRPKDENGNPRNLTEEEKIKLGLQTNFAANVQTNARITENVVISEISGQWPDQVPEIRKYLSEAPLSVKARDDYEGYCRNIVKLVVGDAALKNGFRYDADRKTFFLEDKNTSSTQPDSPLNDPSLVWNQTKGDGTIKRWSPEEQLRKLGIDPKEFVERQKEAN